MRGEIRKVLHVMVRLWAGICDFLGMEEELRFCRLSEVYLFARVDLWLGLQV